MQLAKKADQMKEKGASIVTVHASKVEEKNLDEWTKKNNIPFPVELIQNDGEKTRFNWGVKSLPWLILTDRNHIVVAEGFGLDELSTKISEAKNAK